VNARDGLQSVHVEIKPPPRLKPKRVGTSRHENETHLHEHGSVELGNLSESCIALLNRVDAIQALPLHFLAHLDLGDTSLKTRDPGEGKTCKRLRDEEIHDWQMGNEIGVGRKEVDSEWHTRPHRTQAQPARARLSISFWVVGSCVPIREGLVFGLEYTCLDTLLLLTSLRGMGERAASSRDSPDVYMYRKFLLLTDGTIHLHLNFTVERRTNLLLLQLSGHLVLFGLEVMDTLGQQDTLEPEPVLLAAPCAFGQILLPTLRSKAPWKW